MANAQSHEPLARTMLSYGRSDHNAHKNCSIECRKITSRTVKERARKVLELTQKCAQGAPEVLDGDGLERTCESEADKVLMRKVAAEAIVLLKNQNHLLPLKPKVSILFIESRLEVILECNFLGARPQEDSYRRWQREGYRPQWWWFR